MSSSSDKGGRLQSRLEEALKEQKYYEAHQLYKTLYFRASTKRNHGEAIRILFEGSTFFLTNKQFESGTDLAKTMVDLFEKHNLPVTDSHVQQFCDLLRYMEPRSEQRSIYIAKVLVLISNSPNQQATFNKFLARQMWQEGSFEDARYRIMLTNDGYVTGNFLIQLNTVYGLPSEIDLFVTQSVLQYLCLRQILAAETTFYTYTRKHPAIRCGPPFTKYPLLNFIWFLMIAIEDHFKLDTFQVLCDMYGPQLKRDASYSDYLRKIAQIYFGLKPRNQGPQGLFGEVFKMMSGGGQDGQNLFSDLLGGLNEEVDDDGSEKQPSTSLAMDDIE